MLTENTKPTENFTASSTILQCISKHYYIVMGALFLVLSILNCFIKVIPIEYTGFILLCAFISFTVISDLQRDVKIKSFLLIALPYLLLISFILATGNGLWHKVLEWETGKNIIFNLNSLFSKMPFNDASFTRIFAPSWLTYYMKMVYNTGFVLAVVVPLLRSALAIDFKKMLKYTLSAHVFQVFIITPFYIIFYLQEVWVVNGQPDMLGRNLTGHTLLETTLNCLPSMHTSIAFAVFLLVLRERNKIFKWVWGFYCLSVIYSTMYLEIHWVIDVIGGLILGYLTVKLVDFVLAKADAKFTQRFKSVFYEENSSAL